MYGKDGHLVRSCMKKERGNLWCYTCNEIGHLAQGCSKKICDEMLEM